MLVLVAGYPDLEAARHDFAALLTDEVERGRFLVKGAALLTKDADGTPTVVEIGNHLGCKRGGWGAGIGITVGFFAAPLAGSVVLGAAAGAMLASFASHELKTGLQHEITRVLDAGTGPVVLILPPDRLFWPSATSRAQDHQAAQAAAGASADSVGTSS